MDFHMKNIQGTRLGHIIRSEASIPRQVEISHCCDEARGSFLALPGTPISQ